MKRNSIIKFAIAVSIPIIIIYLASCSRSKDTKEKLAECYKFADEHWLKSEYEDWLYDSVYHSDYRPPNPNVTRENVCDTFWYWDPEKSERMYFPHNLPDKKIDQYYEMVGKYEQFKFGWDDFPEEGLEEIHRNAYLECLGRATKKNKSSPTGLE